MASTSVAFYRQHKDFRKQKTAPCDKVRAGALKQQAGISGDGAGSRWRIGCGKNKCRCGRLPSSMEKSEDEDRRFKKKS